MYDVKELNAQFSVVTYQTLALNQRAKFKTQLSEAILKLKKDYKIQMLTTELLFKMAANKANFTTMEMVNRHKQLGESAKNLFKDKIEVEKLRAEQNEILEKLHVLLVGSYALFNAFGDETIIINAVLLHEIMK